MSNLLRMTPRLSKKKKKDEEKNDKSTTGKIMHEIKSHFQKDKSSEFRKSKKKKKEKEGKDVIAEKEESEISDKKETVEAVNESLVNNDSKESNESSSPSNYPYDLLNDSRGTSECSSVENLPSNTFLHNYKINRRQSSASVNHLNQNKAPFLSRRNSTSQFITRILRKSKTEEENEEVKVHRHSSIQNLQRKPSTSIKRKIYGILSWESQGTLKRSTSIRDFIKKKDDNQKSQWTSSLQSLVENDIGVSCNDLSFVNYDVMNTCSYEVKPIAPTRHLTRSQSVSVQNVYQPHPNNRLSLASDVLDRYSQSSLDLTFSSEAASLPTLHQLVGQNVSPGTGHRYRRRLESSGGEEPSVRQRCGGGGNTASSFRSSGSGCSKLRRQNACRQVRRDSTPGPDTNIKLVPTQLKEGRSTDSQAYEWRKLVGSIRRRVQRHGTSSSEGGEEPPPQPLKRKSSLTQHKLDFFRREKSRDEPEAAPHAEKAKDHAGGKGKKAQKEPPLAKQKSVGFEDLDLAAKHLESKLFLKPSDSYSFKGVRKSDTSKHKDNKVQKSTNFSFRTNLKSGKAAKDERHMNRDDFLKATMRIFLVVSPPVGKMQVRSRSLNHLDTLEHTLRPAEPAAEALEPVVGAVGGPDSPGGPHGYSRSESDCSMARAPERLQVPADQEKRASQRRQMLSRSQVSSSEYFSVSFELGEDSSIVHGREEFLPATKGTSLGDALVKVCERRSIDLSTCDIYIDGCKSPAPYVLNQETSALGGKTIRITAKESSNKKSSSSGQFRKPSGSYKGKASSLFFSTSTEDSTNLSSSLPDSKEDQSKKQSKQRWSGFFSNNKDTRMESLVDQLNYYARHGVPDSGHSSMGVDEEIIDALYNLEDDWRQLVDPNELSERHQQQLTAIWELITTEVAYIKTLGVVTGLFLSCLKSLQSSHILTEIDTEKLFSNITEIRECNMIFWSMCLYPAVVKMRTTREPISPSQFLDGFMHMRETYKSYFRYCAEQARCQHYCRDNHAHNEVFTAYLAWCETQKECNRLRLMDILVRPMQRLTKYGLLLKAILKNTDDDYEKDCLVNMLKSVDDFVNSVNSSLRQKQDNERLRGIMLRIESYDVVETKDDDIQTMVQRYNQLDLSQPMAGCPPDRKRHLLLEGDLKLKDSTTSKMEVHCFLLTDILLICKPSSKKGGALMRVIRPPYLVDRLVLQELNRETPSLALVYLNEFKTASAAFILQNNDQKKLKSWAECIRKAQNLYEQAKQTPLLGLTRQLSSCVPGDEYLEQEYFDYNVDGDSHSLQSLIPRSPLASSSRASRGSSLAHSHSGSVEMNDQSSIGSTNNASRGISIENENRTASISSDEGVQPLPADKSPINQKNSLKQRLLPKTLTPNTLSVQPYGNLGQSLPNLTLGSPNVGTLNLSPNNTLLVPTTKNGQHLLSPNQRGISYPPPSPTRGNLRRGFAITQSKNPPLIKTGHVNSTAGAICTSHEPTNFDFDVPVIAGVSPPDDVPESFNRGQHRQAMLKRIYRSDNRRYHTAGVVDDIKKSDEKDTSIQKRLSWNCASEPTHPSQEDHAT